MAGTFGHNAAGRCVDIAAKMSGSGAAGNDDLIIRTAVGKGGAVTGPDVKKVQAALNNIPVELGGPDPKLVPDGHVGPKTIAAIEAFQQRHFGFKDGRVDPLGKTHAKISSFQPLKIARMKMAKDYLDVALTSMTKASFKIGLAQLALVNSSSLQGGPALDHVDRVFDIRKSGNPAGALVHVLSIYTRMLSVFQRTGGLWGWQAFEGEPFAQPDIYAFTWWGGFDLPGKYAGWQRLDTIYLSGFFDKASNIDRVQTIVHELAHFVGPNAGDQIFDYAYGTTKDLAGLSPYQKQHNAECYGNFAIQCHFGQNLL